MDMLIIAMSTLFNNFFIAQICIKLLKNPTQTFLGRIISFFNPAPVRVMSALWSFARFYFFSFYANRYSCSNIKGPVKLAGRKIIDHHIY